MKPFMTAYKQQVLTGALLAALAINATWRFASQQYLDFASTTAELEETVVTADGAYKAKYYVIGNRTTVKLEAMEGGVACELCNTYDLDGVVLDRSNKKSITDVNVALLKQIEARKKGTATVAETAAAKPAAKPAIDPKAADAIIDACSNDRGDDFTFCAVNTLTSLSASLKDDKNSRAQIDQLYKKHIRKNLLKMMADIESEERSTEAYDTARQMIEDLYPSNAKGVQEDLTNLISKAMTARAVDISDKFVVAKSMEKSNPQEAMMLFNEFLRERSYFDGQIRSVGNEVTQSFSGHIDDGTMSQSAIRMLMLKAYSDPMKRVRDILWGTNPERLAGSYSDADLGNIGTGLSRGTTSRTGRSLRDSLGRGAVIAPTTGTVIQRGTTPLPTTTSGGRARF